MIKMQAKYRTYVIALAVPVPKGEPCQCYHNQILIGLFTEKKVSAHLSNVIWIGGCKRLHFFICYVGKIA